MLSAQHDCYWIGFYPMALKLARPLCAKSGQYSVYKESTAGKGTRDATAHCYILAIQELSDNKDN